MRSSQVIVAVDLPRIRANAQAIREATQVAIIAVVKADAYGLGAAEVARAVAGVVDGLAVFSLAEAQAADLWQASRMDILAMGPPDGPPEAYRKAHVRPAVSTVHQARRYRHLHPAVCVDTGMRRFACPLDQVAAVVAAGDSAEAFTHAVVPAHARRLLKATRRLDVKRHAAASSLVGVPEAHLDAVRPGFLLYRGAVRVSAPLVAAAAVPGRIGYSGFRSPRHGIILAGYAHGLRVGWCLVNGHRRRIREIGMQTAYLDVGDDDAVGDDVVLLGDGLSEEELAGDWGARPHEVLITLSGAGERVYRRRAPVRARRRR